jgi:resolvase-like protein
MTNVQAAQYLRVSTERQEYSLDFQSARIANYAEENGFEVCQTYCDEAKSGLEIRRRTGLSQLLQDVVGGKQSYKAVLVYDVSRWGRFQDPDEAAHYEFLGFASMEPPKQQGQSSTNREIARSPFRPDSQNEKWTLFGNDAR